MTKPSARVVEERIEAPLNAMGSTRPSTSADAAIVDPADGGNDLAGDDALPGAVRPVRQTPAAQANGAAGEEIVGAQAGYRIARQQEHKGLADPADAGGTRRPHRDAVDGEFPDFGNEPRCMVLAADAGASGHEDHVGARREERGADLVRIVAEPVAEVRASRHRERRARAA